MDSAARTRGFTLIEVIITVAIVAILATVALPTYRDHIRKSRRAEAQAYLMAVAGRQQQFLLDTRGYAPNLTTVGDRGAGERRRRLRPRPWTPSPDRRRPFASRRRPRRAPTRSTSAAAALAIDQAGAKTAASSSCW